ncbi:MAG: QueT transporter family protein [Clostridia bacterium]|nr:QueT transporter family protein [Clostridia bacterium]
MQKNKKHVRFLCEAALIAAIYVILTYFCAAVGMSSGAIQLRFSEALCIFGLFTPAALPGVALGCFMANLLTGCALWDIVFGSLASLIGMIGLVALKKFPYIAPVPYALANMIIVPFVVKLVYAAPEALPLIFLTVGIGEIISVFGFGIPLYLVLKKHKNTIFK